MGRPRLERCVAGHELTAANRYIWRGQQKGCLACRRTNSTRFRRRLGIGPMEVRPVPAEPLLRLIDRVGIREFSRRAAGLLGVYPASIERNVNRARERGTFTVYTADDFCLVLDMHPVEVFGGDWFAYGAREVADAV